MKGKRWGRLVELKKGSVGWIGEGVREGYLLLDPFFPHPL